jgi:hypothetical protein
MLPSFSRGLRLALVLALSVGYVAWHGHSQPAFAKGGGGGDEEEGGGGDDDSGDDDSSAKTTDEDGEGGEEDKDQPPVTAGGLFTLNTYPVNEILRPLTITQHITQLRLGIGTDISDKGAFDSAGVSLEVQHGLADNFSLIGGLTSAYNFKQFGIYAGFEGALIYDLLDIRVAANVHKNAIPIYQVFCNPPATPNEMPVGGACQNASATQDNLPSGKYDNGDLRFSLDVGFPFRYAIKPEIAIIALQTLMSIDFNSVNKDFAQVTPIANAPMGAPQTMTVVKGNGGKPDFNPSLGIAVNPVPALSLVAFGQFRIPDFDFSAGAFQIPLTARVEFSPSQKFDVGLEFTLLNVKPPEGQSPIENRFISLFVQARLGQ